MDGGSVLLPWRPNKGPAGFDSLPGDSLAWCSSANHEGLSSPGPGFKSPCEHDRMNQSEMSESGFLVTNSREEVIRTEKVQKPAQKEKTVSLSCGGQARLSVLTDVEEFVGEVGRKNDYRISEYPTYYTITVYRTKEVCEKSACTATAESKFDGTWLCDTHMSTYTAQYIG